MTPREQSRVNHVLRKTARQTITHPSAPEIKHATITPFTLLNETARHAITHTITAITFPSVPLGTGDVKLRRRFRACGASSLLNADTTRPRRDAVRRRRILSRHLFSHHQPKGNTRVPVYIPHVYIPPAHCERRVHVGDTQWSVVACAHGHVMFVCIDCEQHISGMLCADGFCAELTEAWIDRLARQTELTNPFECSRNPAGV